MQSQQEIYFFGAKTNGFLSQHYLTKFSDGVNEYSSAEQYMMYQKAALFGDKAIAEKILAEKSPTKIKALGRKIKGFNESKWDERKYVIVTMGNMHKFSHNHNLGKRLVETGDAVLIEASPFDRVWGIGYGATNAPTKRDKWGQNLLGRALMEVRANLRTMYYA